jgi:hypothetical protein
MFPLGDIAALAEAIAEILTLPTASEAIAAKSRMYSVAAAADGIEAALLETLGKPKATTGSPDRPVR